MSNKLLKEEEGEYWVKDAQLLDEEKLQTLSPKTVEILKKVSEEETYPKRIADQLGIHEQKVYYHIKKLEDLDLIEVSKKERKGGALCKFYRATSKAFAFDLDGGWNKIKPKKLDVSDRLLSFLSEFTEGGKFHGSIVVGSPKEHGPFMTSARDGHYAVQLGIFLGNFCDLENRFVVKLDTEVKAEDALDRHLLLIGGPITNTISRDLNENLKVKFDWEKTWKIVSEVTGNEYSGENLALIAKIQESDHSRILISGLDFKGTKTGIIALTQYYDEILEDYDENEEFYRVIKGLDRDGDGKTDDIEILE